mmetsp:Transcript_5232/g.14042  ORF Transcript_5232/g.14042 Transcript_5232/m.14042 type:complete len:80 (+) Transcript_5232:738-977(+)
MSRWFVGSSSSRTCGLLNVIAANATRLFWPPDRVLIGRSAMSALTPSLERCPRNSGSAASAKSTFMCSSGVRHRTNWST